MRIYYCPVHGRVTEVEALVAAANGCTHCEQFYLRRAKKKAKRPGES